MDKTASLEELFCGMPQLLAYFNQLKSYCAHFRRNKSFPSLTKERMLEMYQELLNTAKSINITDIHILYYFHHITGFRAYTIRDALRKIYRAECAFKNECLGKTVFFDILDLTNP